MLEIFAYILAPFIASGAIYHLAKFILDSIWNYLLKAMGESGALGDDDVNNLMYHLMLKG